MPFNMAHDIIELQLASLVNDEAILLDVGSNNSHERVYKS
jgi:hypothetical protein